MNARLRLYFKLENRLTRVALVIRLTYFMLILIQLVLGFSSSLAYAFNFRRVNIGLKL